MNFIKTFLILVLAFIGVATYVHAEDANDTMTTNETSEEVVVDSGDEDITLDDTQASAEEESTEDEAMNDEDLFDSEDEKSLLEFEGEVTEITENEVTIQTEDGEIITVSREDYESNVSTYGFRATQVGDKIESGVVDLSSGTPVIATKSGTYTVSESVSVIKNGSTVSLTDIEDGDEVAVILDAEGNLVFLEILSDIEDASNRMLVGTIVVIVAIILLAFVFGKKKSTEELA